MESTGATSLFVGTTRDNFQGKKVVKLEYEAYTPMAKKKLQELCNRVRVKWPEICHIAVYHRLGPVGPCQASVIIGKIIFQAILLNIKSKCSRKSRVEIKLAKNIP